MTDEANLLADDELSEFFGDYLLTIACAVTATFCQYVAEVVPTKEQNPRARKDLEKYKINDIITKLYDNQ